MKQNNEAGILVALDGFANVGKPLWIVRLEEMLREKGYQVYDGRISGDTMLRHFLLKGKATLIEEAYACLTTALRYSQIEKEVLPYLRKGYIVLTDWYILSSMIRHCTHGMDAQFVMDINRNIYKPDLQVVVTEDESVIENRRQHRDILTIFEQEVDRNDEISNMVRGAYILEQLNVRVSYINNGNEPQYNAGHICDEIVSIIGEK